ncbi:MAG: divalent metal cation transporter [Verrucomicrobia bacterium]|nr:divalent metal cation transporter [Verrucomicrobiota bacterium]
MPNKDERVQERPPPSLEEPPPRRFLQTLGPGLITGASDDDPSGIATYSQAGAQFGFSLLWTSLFSYPLMAAVQEISARVGRVTGRGIAGNMRRNYPRWLVFPLITLVLVANTLNLAADISAMGAALQLLVGGHPAVYAILFALGSLVLQIFVPYTHYASLLKWLSLSLLAYVGTVFTVHVPWAAVLRQTALPPISLSAEYLTALLAVLGTTISPYLFFWQASAEVEEVKGAPREKPLRRAPEQAPAQLARIKLDTYLGMAASNVIAFFIILTAAATLHATGKTDIGTAAEAAEALRPVAGPFASLLFASGVIGTGLLAIPVLAGSAAYAVSEALRWRTGLGRKPTEAVGFYGVLSAATLIGLGLTLTSLDPIRALFWSAVLNGIVAVPIMLVMMLMATNTKVMGAFTISGWLRLLGWTATAVMALASIGLFATWGR